MITDVEKWHYLAVRSLSALLRGITSNHNGDFYCFNCFHSCSTENNLKEHEEKCNIHDYCRTETRKWFEKILKYSHGEKLWKIQFFISFDVEVLLPKMLSSQNNPEKSYTDKKSKHIPSLTCMIFNLFIWFNKEPIWLF